MSRTKERIHQRFEVALPLRIVAQGAHFEATTANLGLGGARILTDAPLKFGEAVRVQLKLPDLDQESEVDCIVRWLEEGAAGLQFGSLRARDVWGLNRLFQSMKAPD